ncbi:hypothetical protein [Wolbachia endosymbiont (group A) of Phalera bucephala]|uniref:hypothetical protein n=2 Tax=Wolbachieae TaxID=952 RepID=UPI002227C28F|nr:hypothetical protein [Wolbachia endosymbiont (group A) of Phalera bucephala]GKS78967.1 hypothetical protein wHma_09740 [Wolbachia pipientis]
MLDTGIQPFCNLIGNVVTTFYTSLLVSNLDPSVSYSDDKKRSTGMTGEGGYLDDIIGALERQSGVSASVIL